MGVSEGFALNHALKNGSKVAVRVADASDSPGIANIWNSVVKEGKFTMGLNIIDEDFEREYISGLDEREAFLVAEMEGKLIGYLLIIIPEKICLSTSHVAEVGTWVLKGHRGIGVGDSLLKSAFAFAKENGYEKMMVMVRSSNVGALKFYDKHGFKEIGRFGRQVKIGGKYDDHVLMERFL